MGHLKNGVSKSQNPEFRAPDFSGVRSPGLRKLENVDFAAIYFWNSSFLALASNVTLIKNDCLAKRSGQNTRLALKYLLECVTFHFIGMVRQYVQLYFVFLCKTERPICIRLSCGLVCNEIFSFRLLVLSHAQPCCPMHSHAAHGHFRLVVAVVAVHPVDSALRLLVRWRFVRGSSHVRWMLHHWIGFSLNWLFQDWSLRVRRIDYPVCFRIFACFGVLIEQCLFLCLLRVTD